MGQNKKSGSIFFVLFGLIFIGAGIFMSILGIRTLENAKASASWPQVEGEIVLSKVNKTTSSSGSSKNRRRKTKYIAEICYEYTVNGNKYSSDNVSFGSTGNSSSQYQAKQKADQYPKGKTVKVYYNPENPDTSVLEPGVSMSSYIPLIGGIIFAIAGLATGIGGIIKLLKK